jgi:hypothetical protein
LGRRNTIQKLQETRDGLQAQIDQLIREDVLDSGRLQHALANPRTAISVLQESDSDFELTPVTVATFGVLFKWAVKGLAPDEYSVVQDGNDIVVHHVPSNEYVRLTPTANAGVL